MLVLPAALAAGGGYANLTGGRYVLTDNAYVQQDKVSISADVSAVRIQEPRHSRTSVSTSGDGKIWGRCGASVAHVQATTAANELMANIAAVARTVRIARSTRFTNNWRRCFLLLDSTSSGNAAFSAALWYDLAMASSTFSWSRYRLQ